MKFANVVQSGEAIPHGLSFAFHATPCDYGNSDKEDVGVCVFFTTVPFMFRFVFNFRRKRRNK